MSTPALEITAYTPLETLLLFYNLSTHGIHPTSFSLISNILVRNPLVKNGDTFDRNRLAPDALKEFYLLQLREAELELGSGGDGQPNGDGGRQGSPATSRKKKAKTPPAALSNPDKTGVVKILTSRLYEKYRNTVFQQIRDDERRYAELDRDFNDISAGLWDERLLRENAVKTRSRSSSTTPKSSKQKRVSSSPGSDRRNPTPSVSPIAEARDEPLATKVSVEVSPRALPAARTPTAQHAVPQLATQKSPQLKSSLPLRPNNHSGKPEQQNTPRNATDRPPRNVPASTPLSQQSPPPHTQDQEGQKESYMPLAQTKRDVMKVASTPPKTQPTAVWSNQTIQTASPSPRQTQAHRALAAPIPSPQVPQKMEAVPPPPPSSTSSPIAPPLSRPGVKIEAPVPPPTRTPFPPITPRPIQGPYPQPQNTPSRPSSVPGSGQGPQGLTGLQQLADVADTRWQQQHTPPFVQHGAPPGQHIVYSSPGQPVSYGPAPISPSVQQGHRTPTPSTPGATAGFGVLFPTPLPTTPAPPVQQYPPQFSPQNQARQAGVQTPNFQHYNPHVAAQQQQQSFEQAPPVPSPTVQRIAPRPPPLAPPAPPPQVPATSQQSNPISPSKTRPPPIVTSTGSADIPPFSHSPGHKGEPGSPIPPRPDEISPISTPSRSPPPPPESPKLAVSVEKPRGKKRLFQDDGKSPQERRKSGGSKENTKQARADRAKEDKPAPKRQKKHEKTPAKSPVARRGSVVEKEVGVVLAVPESKVKDEEADVTEIESDAPVSIVDEEEKPQKPRGRGRPRGKAKPPPPPEEQVEPPVKEKRTKRKRTEVNAPTPQTVDDDEEESEAEAASVSPTPQRRHFPKLEKQGSNMTNSVPSPSPLTVSIGQQPLVVATKKFLQLSAPLLGDISSHKFANLFSHAVNERMAPGYRNLVFRPQDLKSIKAAVKSGTAAITNTSTGTPAMTPTTDFAAATPPASSSTFATLPATTLNTPPKGIVNSVQLEKELFRMFANAIMYNKSTTEIGKETVIMARDVEGMVDNFRTAEEAGMKKALGAAATGGGFGSARKGGVRDRERETTVGTAGDEEQSISGDKEDGDEDSVMGDTDGASEKGKGKAIVKRKRLKR
ncbi:hypothetical protein P167DRAFT_545085 [Morchella conica CCBAS932]|uniref:Bromo domain-containing protein n=1 Tax=Morchella conica CCBAS932 TaxID=1392247 RepID=A0A3N4KR56_9PEZI|nr:hypothetical protein P167DRAFT_545085 [Morchella conica CCBAS932]